MTTRARIYNPCFDSLPLSLVKPQSVTSGTPIDGTVVDTQPIAGRGMCVDADIALTMGVGGLATDKIVVECKVQHSDTSGSGFVDFKTLDTIDVFLGGAGAYQRLVEWPRVNLEGAKRYIRVVYEITADAGNTGTVSAIVSNVQARMAAQRDRTQDDNYDQDGYVAAKARVSP